MSMAEGVIVAKARSMHGEALSEEMYQELLHKKSVAEIAGYLKHETSYAAALKDVRENNIHRGQLESILRQEIFKKTMKLYRYADAAMKPYYRLHMQQIEIDLILSRIRVLISQEYEAAIAEFPIFLKPYTSFDLLRLGNVHSYDELLDVLKHTMYYAILLPYRVKKGEENDIDYTKIETQLQVQHYTHTFQVIDKTLKGKSRKAVKQYFATQIELSNIEKIYRYKKYFNAREDVIRESLVPVHEHLSAAFVKELIAQPNARAFIKLLQSSTYRLGIEDMEKDYVYIEHYTDSFLYALAKKNIYYSLDAPLVYSSYLYTAERELENIINIIEGVRYHVSIEDMERMLIY